MSWEIEDVKADMLRIQGDDAGGDGKPWVTTGERSALYCGDGKGNAGQWMAKMPRIIQMQQESDRELKRRCGKGSSDACPLGDAAQSVTHLDVLARVVTS